MAPKLGYRMVAMARLQVLNQLQQSSELTVSLDQPTERRIPYFFTVRMLMCVKRRVHHTPATTLFVNFDHADMRHTTVSTCVRFHHNIDWHYGLLLAAGRCLSTAGH